MIEPGFSFELSSPAKLNLFLHITGRRDNGYHDLQTLFQILDYGDRIHFEVRSDSAIEVSPEIDGLAMEQNLVFKAAEMLRSTLRKRGQSQLADKLGLNIHIGKKLPTGGGVGGGSSNAATTLLALNKLWGEHLSIDQLAELGLQLGADVPVFVRGKSAWAEGVGEIIKPVQLPSKYYLVIKPNCHVATAQIFSHERLTRDTPKTTIAPALEGRLYTDLKNDCEPIVKELYPEIEHGIDWLSQFGYSRLTGTGACCFSVFDDYETAMDSLKKTEPHFEGFVARGVDTSPTVKELQSLAF